jgi:hypothetical protein
MLIRPSPIIAVSVSLGYIFLSPMFIRRDALTAISPVAGEKAAEWPDQ